MKTKKVKREHIYHCSICTYTVEQKGRFLRHKRTHTAERPFKCPMCPYAATQNSDLTKHANLHLNNKDYKFKAHAKKNVVVDYPVDD